MKEPEELTAKANDEVMNNMRWELSLVGLNTGEIDQQVDAFIEYHYHWQTKGWGSVSTAYTDDQIVDKQRDTSVPAGTCCLGTPELASSKMDEVSRERKRTQTTRTGQHGQMKTTQTTTKQSRRKGWPMRRLDLQQPLYWQSTYHSSSTTLIINQSAMATLLLLNMY